MWHAEWGIPPSDITFGISSDCIDIMFFVFPCKIMTISPRDMLQELHWSMWQDTHRGVIWQRVKSNILHSLGWSHWAEPFHDWSNLQHNIAWNIYALWQTEHWQLFGNILKLIYFTCITRLDVLLYSTDWFYIVVWNCIVYNLVILS